MTDTDRVIKIIKDCKTEQELDVAIIFVELMLSDKKNLLPLQSKYVLLFELNNRRNALKDKIT